MEGTMTHCKHAASGCGYPEGECAGLCMPETYLTIVYRVTHPKQPRALLEQAEWSAASHSHAIHERDQLQAERDRLQRQLDATNKACNELAIELEKVRRERDHWHARLTHEVNKRNKPEAA